MKKLNQLGMIGPMEIGAIVLVIAVIGFTGYRIGSARTEVSEVTANAQNDAELTEAARLALKEQAEKDAKEIDVPKEEEKTEELPEPVKQEPVYEQPKEEPKEEVKKDYTYINFTKGGGGQNGDGGTVSASATLESAQTGTCNVKFYKEGYSKVYTQHEIVNDRTCAATSNISEFEVAGEWEVHIWFESSDGKIKAWQDTYPIDVVL